MTNTNTRATETRKINVKVEIGFYCSGGTVATCVLIEDTISVPHKARGEKSASLGRSASNVCATCAVYLDEDETP